MFVCAAPSMGLASSKSEVKETTAAQQFQRLADEQMRRKGTIFRYTIRRKALRQNRIASAPIFVLLLLYTLSVTASPPVLIARGHWFLQSSKPARAMTTGCEKGTCCTEFCYLDEHGVHHCVPRKGESCSCGFSSSERAEGAEAPLEIGILPAIQNCLPPFPHTEGMRRLPLTLSSFVPPVPTPPPEILPPQNPW